MSESEPFASHIFNTIQSNYACYGNDGSNWTPLQPVITTPSVCVDGIRRAGAGPMIVAARAFDPGARPPRACWVWVGAVSRRVGSAAPAVLPCRADCNCGVAPAVPCHAPSPSGGAAAPD